MDLDHKNDEIDLFELLAKSLLTIYKHSILLSVCLLIGISTAWLTFGHTNKTKWKTQMMISTPLLTEEEAKFIFKDFELDSIAIANNIVSVVTEPKTNFITKEVFLTLTVTTNSQTDIQTLKNALFQYIDASNPVIRKRKQNIAYNSNLKTDIETEINFLQKERIKGMPLDDSYLNILQDRKMQFEQALTNTNSVNLVKGFPPTELAVNHSLFLLIGAVAGVVLAFIIVATKKFFRYFLHFQKNQG